MAVDGALSGTFNLTAPQVAGQYEFRYLLQNGFTDSARSATLTVGAPVGYSVSATPTSVAPNGNVTVSWTAPSGSSNFDWIGLFRVGTTNREYLAYVYTGGTTSGNAVFRMPAQTGSYEFRYLLDDGYTEVRATSNTVTVQ